MTKHAHQCRTILMGVGLFSAMALADGLPGEAVVTHRWRELFLAHSALYNPAFLADENYATFRGAYSLPLRGQFQLWEGGLTIPIGLEHSLGFTWIGLNAGDIERTEWNAGIPVKTGEAMPYQSNFFALSYAILLMNRIGIGLNVNLAHDNLFGEENRISIPPGVDLGVTLRLLRHPRLGWHQAGLFIQNLLAPTMKSAVSADEQYVRNLRLSWLGNYWNRQIFNALDFDFKDFISQAEEFAEGAKIEYGVSLKIGGWLLRVFKLWVQAGLEENNAGYWGVAGGVNMPSINGGRELEILYQFNSLFQGQGVNTHTLYLRAEAGKHREELYARKLARMLDYSANDLYNRGLKLYYAKKYWDAFFVFGQILSQFPDFFKNDWVQYYFASCQEEMDMRNAAIEGYNAALDQYPNSEAAPFCNLGLMRIAVRNENHIAAAQQFDKLNRPETPDTLRAHAYYLMGQVRLAEKDFAKAVQALEMVPERHPLYAFAQHSLAVAQVNAAKMEEAINAFENAVTVVPKTPEQTEIYNRSMLLAGYLFIEQRSLGKAVAALRKVSASSSYYPDALLGLGWSAVLAKNWIDCAEAADKLAKASDKPIMQCEAMLLQALYEVRKKNYANAAEILTKAQIKLASARPPSEEELLQRKDMYSADRIVYDTVAATARDLALSHPSALVRQKTDSLKVLQERGKEKIDAFLRYQDNFIRTSLLFRTLKDTKSDIEYALATAERLKASKKAGEALKQEQDLDKEIEKLKGEVEEMKKNDKGE